VHWVDVPDPDPDLEAGAESCFAQGRSRGGAAFSRLEGLFRAEDGRSVYFVSTTGGQGLGQIWKYVPAPDGDLQGELALVFESPERSVLAAPDNLCLSPQGALLCCEDASNPLRGRFGGNRLIGIAGAGRPFAFARNVHNSSEFAGSCFSADGALLFVNIQGDREPGSGMTCAIWGPWERGPL